MKLSEKLVKVSASVAGVCAIASAFLLTVFVLLAELGMIHPRQISITVTSETVHEEYCGKAISGGLNITRGALADGHEIQILSQPALTEVGAVENEIAYIITDVTGADVTARYLVTESWGTITVQPRSLGVETVNAKKIYDGTPISGEKTQITWGSLVTGHTLVADHYASLEKVGVVDNTASIRILDAVGRDVSGYYSVELKCGTLTVNPRPLTIATESAKKNYDGKPLKNENYQIKGGSLVEGHKIEVDHTTVLDRVGFVDNQIKLRILDTAGADVTDQYGVKASWGRLEIEGRYVKIVTESADKIYDGTPLSAPLWRITGGSLAAGDKLVLVDATSFDDVGKVDNVIRFAVKNANGEDVTDTYGISYSYGTLSVSPKTLSIQMGSGQKSYDGQPLYAHTYKIIAGSLCPGHTLTVTGKGRTDVGMTENDMVSYSIVATLADGTKKDVSKCYQVTHLAGTLKITAPR